MPDVMTLIEYAKGLEKSNINKPLIMAFAEETDIFGALPFEGMDGPSFEFHRVSQLPTTAFRAINEPGTTGHGVMEPFSEASYRIDHDIDVDKAILDREGMDKRSKYERMQAAATGKLWIDTFLAGANTSNPREFNGLQARATGDRLMHNSVAAGGAALSLYNLDKSVKNTRRPTHIIATLDLQPRFIQAARNTSISGFVIQSWDEVGQVKMTYAGLPILWGYPRDLHGVILPFTEVGQGGGSAVTTSLYVVSFGEEGLRGLQLVPMAFDDKGLLEDGITYRTHMTWDVGLVDEHPFCMTRLTSITDAAFVA